eukprot:175100-Prymnesium_polylepis.1
MASVLAALERAARHSAHRTARSERSVMSPQVTLRHTSRDLRNLPRASWPIDGRWWRPGAVSGDTRPC